MANFRIPLNYKEHVNKAVHNLSTIKRTTLHPMTAIPLYCRYMFKGDTFLFSTPQMLLQTQPTIAPVMGNYRLRVEWYFDSDANRYGWIDNNDNLTAQEILERRRHTVQFDATDELRVSGTSLHDVAANSPYMFGYGGLSDYIGIPPTTMLPWSSDAEVYFGNVLNLDYILAYLNIIRTYHTNRQFPDVPYIQRIANNPNFIFTDYNAEKLDDLFKCLRTFGNGVNLNLSNFNIDDFKDEYEVSTRYANSIQYFVNYLKSLPYSYGGLFCTQYEPDLFRNLLNDDISTLKAVLTPNPDGSISIEQFRFKNRLQMIVDRILSVGTRSSDVSRARWGITSSKGRDIPELICVQSEYIDTNLVVSNNAGQSSEGESVAGDLAGNINQRKFPKGKQKFTANEAGVLMAIVTLTPLVDYCQGLDRWLTENNFEDSFSPQMQQKGFEGVPLSDYNSTPYIFNDDDETLARPYMLSTQVGNQIAWLREMTAVNKVHGEFATNGFYETWVLKRQYNKYFINTNERLQNTLSISPYGNPLDFQYVFVGTSLLNPNFYLQMEFDVKGVRPIGRRFMPTLG